MILRNRIRSTISRQSRQEELPTYVPGLPIYVIKSVVIWTVVYEIWADKFCLVERVGEMEMLTNFTIGEILRP